MTKQIQTVEQKLLDLIIHPSTDDDKNYRLGVADIDKLLEISSQAQQEAVKECTENLARYFYNQMPYDGDGKKPEWVENGNSIKQDEARLMAMQVLETKQKEEK